MTQMMRDRVMNKFRKSGLEFLVATDIAARGIDVDDVQVVFNYDLPYDAEDYVHRIGRTGRAGKSGRAISFVSGRELFQIQHIERFTKMRIQRAKVPTAGEVEEARASVFLDKLRATLQSGEFKKQDHLIERLLEEGFNSTDIASALIHHLQSSETAPVAPRLEEERRQFSDPRRNFDDAPRDRRSGRDERPPRRDDRPMRQNFSAERPPAPRRLPENPIQRKPIQAPRVEKPAPVVPSSPAPQTAKPVVPKIAEPAAPKATEPAVPKAPVEQVSKPVFSPKPRHVLGKPMEPSVPKSRASRRTPETQTRLYMNVGEQMGIATGDVVGAILGETGLPAKAVGTVDIRERHLFVDVATESANSIISKLNRTSIKGHKLKVKVA
jgi:ATP-dependent RNA helicase DeaD